MIQHVLVVDIPAGSTAAEAQALLDGPCEQGYFLVNVVDRLAYLRMPVAAKKDTVPVIEIDPVNPDALAVIKKALAKRERITLRELRRVAHFRDFPEKVWYAALTSLERAGTIEQHQATTPGGYAHRVVVVKANV